MTKKTIELTPEQVAKGTLTGDTWYSHKKKSSQNMKHSKWR